MEICRQQVLEKAMVVVSMVGDGWGLLVEVEIYRCRGDLLLHN